MKVKALNIPVRYDGVTHKPGATFDMKDKHFNKNIVEKAGKEDPQEPVDFFALSDDELKQKTNDQLRNFLDQEGIEYKSSDDKVDLIKLITGE